jgi:putative transposase
MITVAHRIQLMPNNKQKTYFRKAIGCCRLAYNWGLDEWKRRYKEGERGLTGRKLLNAFNAIRGEQFPFTYEVTKYATSHAFDDLQTAYTNFFEHRADYPKPHRKKDGEGGFYFAVDHPKYFLSDTHKGLKHLKNVAHNVGGKRQYVNIPNLGYVKMSERLRFNGKVMSVRVSQEGDKFFASFQVQITEEEYHRTHPEASREKHGAVGIDLGLKEAMMLSNGIAVSNPRTLRKHQRKITRLSRQLSKRQHAKTKQERLQGVKRSNNYKKLSRRLGKEHRHIAAIRRDFTQKLTTILTTTYEAIAIEDLNVEGMKQNRKLAKSVSDMAFSELRRQIEYKAAMNGVRVEVADRFFASSKTCHVCGHKHDDLTLGDRTYVCPHCGTVIDRDLNAALNLLSLITSKVGTDYPELTPADLTALHSRFVLNGIATSKVETGRQRKL